MKKKVILSAIAFLLILITGYIYSIINGKENLGGGGGSIDNYITIRNIDVKSKFTIIDLNINTILGEPIFDENGYCELPLFDELKNSSSFKVNEETKIINITIEKDNEIVKEFEFETGSEVSKKILLTSSGNYRIKLNGGGIRGQFKSNIYAYKIF